MTCILYLFPDTNLFIQCRDLGELDWSEWEDFTEIRLMVCLPVQREIDGQKTRGNDRVGRRARKAYSSLFREIATGEKEFQLINETELPMKLFLETPSFPSPELSETLDYTKPDNEIVGCLHRFVKGHSGTDARLLTHDTGPMMTARSLDLRIAPIHDSWLLPPENSNTEREIARLNNEIIQLRKTEPQFTIHCVDAKGSDVDRLELTTRVYESLEESEITEFLELLKIRFPLATEFNVKGPRPMGLGGLFGQPWHFEPPSDESIARYTEQEYPKWLEDCESFLLEVHKTLQRRVTRPTFAFETENQGTRPGNHALIVIRARGDFTICPPPYDDDCSEDEEQVELSIPSPPDPPGGKWVSSSESLAGRMNSMFRGLDLANYTSGLERIRGIESLPVGPVSLAQSQRDPNGFYYKATRSEEAADSFELECEQWRHSMASVRFDGDIFPREGLSKANGVLECEIHAENLSKPVIRKVPVDVTVQRVSVKDYVRGLIDPPWDILFAQGKAKDD